MTQEREQSRISTEVVGQLTDSQKRELSILGLTIFDAQNLDPKNPEHVSQVQATLEDCVYRGLDMQGRVWFSASEQVSPIFDMGLGQRESIVDQLHRMGSQGSHLKYVTVEEGNRINDITPLDPNFSEADSLFDELKGRRTAIAKFHQALFEESQLAPEARALRDSTEIISEEPEQDKSWLKYNMLYGNLIVNLALYQQVGINVEPKDVAALSEIWKDLTARDSRQTELVERMKQVAKGLGIPEQHIEAYTRSILDDINVTLVIGKITLEELRDSQAFAITTQDIQSESLEFEQPQKENEVVYFPEEDLVGARSVIQKLRAMFEHIDRIAKETQDVIYEKPEDDPINSYTDNEYLPFIQQLAPIDLILTYDAALRDVQASSGDNDYPRIEEELTEHLPFSTYLYALIILQAREFNVAETGESVPELEDEGKNLVYTSIKKQVIQDILDGSFDEGMTYEEAVGKLPVGVLAEYVESVDPAKLPDDHLESLLGLDIQNWFSIAADKGVSVEKDPLKQGDIKLVFDVDSEFIRGYFERMPVDIQQELSKKLQHIIVF